MASEIKVGDKFVIKVREVYWNPPYGHSYFIESIPSLVLHDGDIRCLEKYKEPLKEAPHTCHNCVYEKINEDCYPCSRCDKNGDPQDMFQPKGSIIRG